MEIRQSQETCSNLNSCRSDPGSPVNSDSHWKPYKNACHSPQKEILTTKSEPVYKLISMTDKAESDAKGQENAAICEEIQNDLKKIYRSGVKLLEIPSVIEGFLKRLQLKQSSKSFTELKLLRSFLKEISSEKKEAEFYQDRIFPTIANLIIKTNEIFPEGKIPILRQGTNECIHLSEKQCACLLAHMLMCLTIDQGNDKLGCSNNFYQILSSSQSKVAKLKLLGIFNYFKRLIKNPSKDSERDVVFEHLSYDEAKHGGDSLDAWIKCNDKLTSIQIEPNGRIEDAQNATQVAFSDKAPGEILKAMATQQSIMFFTSPELIVGCLFCETLTDKDALAVRGAKKFNKYNYVKGQLEFEGDWPDTHPPAKDKVFDIDVVMIDALNFRHYVTTGDQSDRENSQFERSTSWFEDAAVKSQFSQKNIFRELNKALLGFSFNNRHKKPIATGKWGCGTSGGNPHLKFIIQWIAASRNQRSVHFYLFDGGKDLKGVEKVIEYYAGKTVGELVRDLLKCCEDLPTLDQASDSLWKRKEESRITQVLEDLRKSVEKALKINLEKEESWERQVLEELMKFLQEASLEKKGSHARNILRTLPLFNLILLQTK